MMSEPETPVSEDGFEGMEDMEPFDGFMSYAEADADALASA